MYQGITYEKIVARMIARVRGENPNLDTREGSIIFDALAPAAMELGELYLALNRILNETFADTASREMLIRRVAERGLVPQPATRAVLQGEFNIDIPIGTRFSLERWNYIVTEQIAFGVFKLECETLGIVGNQNFGALIPIDYIDGLTYATLTALLIPAEDDEETEQIRSRYFRSLESEAFGGNIADYIEKTNTLAGVGGVKVYPTPNGGGTVKLVIINSEYTTPSATLLSAVQTVIDPTQNSGQGLGIAPIGHCVTVVGAEDTTIEIAVDIVYENGWAWADVQASVLAMVDDYFKELAEGWAGGDHIIVRVSQIELRLLNLAGIIDVSGTTLDGLAKNMALGGDCIPVRGDVIG